VTGYDGLEEAFARQRMALGDDGSTKPIGHPCYVVAVIVIAAAVMLAVAGVALVPRLMSLVGL
jgi:TRAP-type mannitol/chloroaromatic compound transport system permease small subunit